MDLVTIGFEKANASFGFILTGYMLPKLLKVLSAFFGFSDTKY